VRFCPAGSAAGGGEWVWSEDLGASSLAAIGDLSIHLRRAPSNWFCCDTDYAHEEPPPLRPPFAERRLILYIHGGAFVLCNPATHRPLTANLARMLNCTVLAARYRRAPQHPFPAALDDLTDLYRTLLAHFPAERIVFAGDSAGANLAITLALRTRDLSLPAPGGLVLISPWADLSEDLSALAGSPKDLRGGPDDYIPPELARMFARAYAAATSLSHPLVSPLHAPDLTHLPRSLVVYGDAELLAGQQRRLVARLRQARVPTVEYACPGGMHAFPMFADVVHVGWGRRSVASGWSRGVPARTHADPSAKAAARLSPSTLAPLAGGGEERLELSHRRLEPLDDGSHGALRGLETIKDFVEDVWNQGRNGNVRTSTPEQDWPTAPADTLDERATHHAIRVSTTGASSSGVDPWPQPESAPRCAGLAPDTNHHVVTTGAGAASASSPPAPRDNRHT